MEEVIIIIGYILLWAATDVGRKQDSKIKFMRGKWWLIFGLITVGAYVISTAHKWFV